MCILPPLLVWTNPTHLESDATGVRTILQVSTTLQHCEWTHLDRTLASATTASWNAMIQQANKSNSKA